MGNPSDPPASREASGRVGAPRWRRRQLAGLRAYERSGQAGFLLSTASQPDPGQCSWWRSFSSTAAGQPRRPTGFPLSAPDACPGHQRRPKIWGLVS